jgi:hypothetical protein
MSAVSMDVTPRFDRAADQGLRGVAAGPPVGSVGAHHPHRAEAVDGVFGDDDCQ